MTPIAYVTAILLWLCSSIALGAPFVLNENQSSVALGTYTDYLTVKDKSLTLNEIIQRGDFVSSHSDALNFGLTQGRVWLRLRIDNPLSSAQTRVLNIRYFMLDDVRLYAPSADGSYRVEERGRLHPLHDDRFPGRFYNFELKLPAHSQQTFYISAESADSLALPLFLSTPMAQQQYVLKDTVFLTLFFGLCIANVFFAVFMLSSLRERGLVYYSGFLLLDNILFFGIVEGVPYAVFHIDSLYFNRELIAVAISAAMTLMVLFSRNFLRLAECYPRAYQGSQIMLVMLLLSTVQAIFVPAFYAIFISTSACMVFGLFLGVVSLRCALQGHREARKFLVAWTCGISGATIYGLKVMNLVPVNLFTSYSWHVGTVLESVLFSYTIADRVVAERQQRLKTQTTLADREHALRLTQEKLLHSEMAAKEELESRVRERTRDLSRILADLEIENRNLIELSINDGLTRVRNRRFFNDIYPQLWQEAQERQQWISVIMLDIDHFKAVNDDHGHLMGDQCLVAVASILKQTVSRPDDVVCRYGGEEFIAVLPETEPEAAQAVAERIRIKIRNTAIELEGSSLNITASLGVAGMLPEQGLDPMKLVASADTALYEAKENGRNRVCVADAPVPPDNVTRINRTL